MAEYNLTLVILMTMASSITIRKIIIVCSIHSAFATAIIFGGELTSAVSDIQPELAREVKLMYSGRWEINHTKDSTFFLTRCPNGLRVHQVLGIERVLNWIHLNILTLILRRSTWIMSCQTSRPPMSPSQSAKGSVSETRSLFVSSSSSSSS